MSRKVKLNYLGWGARPTLCPKSDFLVSVEGGDEDNDGLTPEPQKMAFRGLAERLLEFDQSSTLEAAADAITALSEALDAALEDLRGLCWCCVHGK